MTRDRTVSHHNGHYEAALADDLREESIPEVLLLRLLATTSAAVAKCAEGGVSCA